MCSCNINKNPEPDKSKVTYYLYNLQSNEIQSFLDIGSVGIRWSPNSKQFILDKNIVGKSEKCKIELYQINPMKKLELPADFAKPKYKDALYLWNTKGEILISLDKNFFIYDSHLSKVREAKNGETDILYQRSTPSQLTNNEIDKYMAILKETKGKIRYNKTRNELYYISNMDETFLCDTKTGEKKLLFKGVDLAWSCNNNYVHYMVPKEGVNFKKDNRYPSDEFETHVYNLITKEDKKILDFHTSSTSFSIDDNYVILQRTDYAGVLLK